MKYDCVVFGGGMAGFHCAIAAARFGKKVLLVENSGTLGGMATLGLVNPFMQYWLGSEYLVQGIFSELIQRASNLNGINKHTFDSEIFRIIMHQMIENEINIDCLFHTTPFSVETHNSKIKSVSLITNFGEKFSVTSNFFVDCTGNGSLAYLAKANTFSGNELNENQAMTTMFVIGGVDFEAIKKDVKARKENFFNWVKQDMNLVVCAGYFKEVDEAKRKGMAYPNAYFFYIQLPGKGRVTVNTTHVHERSDKSKSVSVSINIGIKQCEIVYQFAKKYVKGFENSYIEKIAPQIGIRENRRISGKYLFSGEDVKKSRKFEDGIVKACYGVDVHKKKATLTEDEKKKVHRYSDFYEIPLRALLSKEFDNLCFAGRCFSSDFQGHSAARIIPTCSGMGQGLGVYLGYFDADFSRFKKNLYYEKLQGIVKIQNNC